MSDRVLLLVRHGVTDWNREGRFQGHLDPPLGDDGRREAELVAARIAASDDAPGRILSSNLARAMETAHAIGAALGVEVEPEERLIEIGQGEWEGRTHAELEVSDPARYAAWRSATGIRRPPGGETIASAVARTRSMLADLDRRDGRDGAWPVCLVSHGGILRIVARMLFGISATHAWRLDVDNASLSVARDLGAACQLERWNDTRHLLGRAPVHENEAEGRPLAL